MSVFRAFRRTLERAGKLHRVYVREGKKGEKEERLRLEGRKKGIAARYRYPFGCRVEWREP